PLPLSCIGTYKASEAAKRNDRTGMIFGMGLNLVLGAAFLLMRVIEWRSFNFTWESDVHGSIVWTILGLHTLDLVADLLFTLVLFVIVMSGRYGEKQRQGVHV